MRKNKKNKKKEDEMSKKVPKLALTGGFLILVVVVIGVLVTLAVSRPTIASIDGKTVSGDTVSSTSANPVLAGTAEANNQIDIYEGNIGGEIGYVNIGDELSYDYSPPGEISYFADDFEDGEYRDKWSVSNQDPSEYDGKLYINGSNSGIESNKKFNENSFSIEAILSAEDSYTNAQVELGIHEGFGPGNNLFVQWNTENDENTPSYIRIKRDANDDGNVNTGEVISKEYQRMVQNQQYHMKFTYDGDTNIANIYINDMNNPVLYANVGDIYYEYRPFIRLSQYYTDLTRLSVDNFNSDLPLASGASVNFTSVPLALNGVSYNEKGGVPVELLFIPTVAGTGSQNTNFLPISSHGDIVLTEGGQTDAGGYIQPGNLNPNYDLYAYLVNLKWSQAFGGAQTKMTWYGLVEPHRYPDSDQNEVYFTDFLNLASNQMGIIDDWSIDAYARVAKSNGDDTYTVVNMPTISPGGYATICDQTQIEFDWPGYLRLDDDGVGYKMGWTPLHYNGKSYVNTDGPFPGVYFLGNKDSLGAQLSIWEAEKLNEEQGYEIRESGDYYPMTDGLGNMIDMNVALIDFYNPDINSHFYRTYYTTQDQEVFEQNLDSQSYVLDLWIDSVYIAPSSMGENYDNSNFLSAVSEKGVSEVTDVFKSFCSPSPTFNLLATTISDTDGQYSSSISLPGLGEYQIASLATDPSGNTSVSKAVIYAVEEGPSDVDAPVTEITLDGTQEPAPFSDWYQGSVEITLTASDLPEGDASGVDKTYYKVGNESSYSIYTTPFTVSNAGINDVYYYSVDNAGNIEETKMITFKIDGDDDGDGTYNNLDDCPSVSGDSYNGCPAKLVVKSKLRKKGAGWWNWQKSPITDMEVNIYQCSYVDALSWKQIRSKRKRHDYIENVKNNCDPVITGYTNDNGVFTTGIETGLALVTSTYIPDEYGDSNYPKIEPVELARVEIVQDWDPNKWPYYNRMHLDVLKYTSRWKQNIKYVPLKSFFVSGSELEVMSPEYVELEDGQTSEDYPFIYESNESWLVSTTIDPPEGYAVDEETKTSFVSGDTETAVFEVNSSSDIVALSNMARVSVESADGSADSKLVITEVNEDIIADCLKEGNKDKQKQCVENKLKVDYRATVKKETREQSSGVSAYTPVSYNIQKQTQEQKQWQKVTKEANKNLKKIGYNKIPERILETVQERIDKVEKGERKGLLQRIGDFFGGLF